MLKPLATLLDWVLRRTITIPLILLQLILIVTLCVATPLDDYVNKPDPAYSYTIIGKIPEPSYTVYIVNMTSQTWKPRNFAELAEVVPIEIVTENAEEFVARISDLQSQPVWWHYLTITIPHKIDTDSAFFVIRGGNNLKRSSSENHEDKYSTLVATTTNSVGVSLKQVPNGPITFKNDPDHKKRRSDEIIAWTWRSFIDQRENELDPEIILQLPMTKAAVQAMDTVQDLVRKETNLKVNRFMVTGGSKRGWISWLTAAVDRRVIGVAPFVMDLLNMVKSLDHHYRSLGGWSFELHEYYNENFFKDLHNPAVQRLADIIDPLAYNERLSDKFKYIVSGARDSYFLLDNSRYYYDQLAGDLTYLRMMPKLGHEVNKPALYGVLEFYRRVIKGIPLPKLTWDLEYKATGGKITLHTDTPPEMTIVHYASTVDDKRRDFRKYKWKAGNPGNKVPNAIRWKSAPAKSLGNGIFVAEQTNPLKGWTAFFIEVTYPAQLVFTTETLITPDTFPFPKCCKAECIGTFV